MARKKTTRKKNPEGRRQAILDASLSLFSEKGFHGTSIQDISKKARVAAGTIYRFFESKEELVNVIFAYWKAKMHEALTVGFPVEASPREQFGFAWRRLAEFAKTYTEAYIFIEGHHHGTYLYDENTKLVHDTTAFIGQWVAALQKKKAIKATDPVILIVLVFGAFTSLIKEQIADKVPLSDAIFNFAEDCCWDLVKA